MNSQQVAFIFYCDQRARCGKIENVLNSSVCGKIENVLDSLVYEGVRNVISGQ